MNTASAKHVVDDVLSTDYAIFWLIKIAKCVMVRKGPEYRDRVTAYDLANEVWVRTRKRKKRTKLTGLNRHVIEMQMADYANTIACGGVNQHYRKKGVTMRSLCDVDVRRRVASITETQEDLEAVKDRCYRLMGMLSDCDRELLKSFYGDDYSSPMSADQIAKKDHTTYWNVQYRRKRALRRLREIAESEVSCA
jgi:hypothetical protein